MTATVMISMIMVRDNVISFLITPTLAVLLPVSYRAGSHSYFVV